MGSPSPRPPCLSFPRGGRPPSLGAGEEEWGAPGGAASVASEAAWGSVNTPHPFFQAPACRLKRRRACVRVCGQGKGPPAPGRTYLKAPSAQLGRGVGNTEGGGAHFWGGKRRQFVPGVRAAGLGAHRGDQLGLSIPPGRCCERGRPPRVGGPAPNPILPPSPARCGRGRVPGASWARAQPLRGVSGLSNGAGWR